MRHIAREIVTAYIVSSDGMLLLGKKPVGSGGVYPDNLHNPGGGVDEGESKLSALLREIQEETGLTVSQGQVELVDDQGTGKSIKSTEGEQIIVTMHFNVYKVTLGQSHESVIVQEGDDLVDFDWYSTKDILTLPLTPPAFDLFDRIGMQWLQVGSVKGSNS